MRKHISGACCFLFLLWFALPYPAASPVLQNPPGTVSGRLLSLDGMPVRGVRIAAIPASPPSASLDMPTVAALAETDSAGRYQLEDMPAGSYYLLAGPFHSPSYYPGVTGLSSATPISVSARKQSMLGDFHFMRPTGIVGIQRLPANVSGHITGTVTDGAQVKLPLTTIVLTSSGTNERFITCTDHTGAFELRRLPPGDFSVDAFPAVNTGFYGGRQAARSPDFGGFESVKDSVTLRPFEQVTIELQLRQWAPVDSAWQKRPDLYARSSHTAFPGGLVRPSRSEPIVVPYPSDFPTDRFEEVVALQALIGIDATLLALQVISPRVDPVLARSALAVASSLKLQPAVLAKRPNDTVTTLRAISVVFRGTREP